jgi:6-phosphogluconolactonase
MKHMEKFFLLLGAGEKSTVSGTCQVHSLDMNAIVDNVIKSLERSSSSDLLHIVLTGGTTGGEFNLKLGEIASSLPTSVWRRVHLWWGDERFLPTQSDQRNDYKIREILGAYFDDNRVHQVSHSNECGSVNEAASLYAQELGRYGSPSPRFTYVLLGMGPDGHVASLFPRSPQLDATEVCVPVLDSPKPPAERVTMTFPTLNNSEKTAIFAAGENKKDALNRLLASSGSVDVTPARGISARELETLT